MFKEFIEAINKRNLAREERDKALYRQGWWDGVQYARNYKRPQITGRLVERQIDEIVEKHGKNLD